MRKYIFAFFLIAALLLPTAAIGQEVKISSDERKMAEAITADKLSSWLHFVASDAMGGRDTPSVGLDVTAEFLRMNLQRWGFKPAGDNGTYFQKMELTRETLDPAKTTFEIGGTTFKLADDFFRVNGTGTVEAPVVFARDGWMVKSKGIDAYAGVDVAGKIVVLSSPGFSQSTMIPRPQGVTDDDLKGKAGEDWANPLAYAKAKGAAAVVVIAPPQLQGMWPQLKNFLGGGTTYPTKLRDTPTGPVIPSFIVSEATGNAIFAGEAADKTSANAFELKKRAKLSAVTKSETLWTQNVVALWEGGDPTLKAEMVAVGAHYDHDGMKPNTPGDDKIYNGADDDGSGTVAVLSIAEALATAKKRPKRSVLLVWHAGEEKGLWGAEYFNKFPTVDIKNVISQLNIDMIGRSLNPANVIKCEKDKPGKPCNENLTGPNEIYVIGSEMMSSTLGAVTKSTNSAYLNMTYNYKYDDPKDEEKFFFRSDHYHYAVNGIPIAFWFNGTHEDYHKPTDTADKIDYPRMEKIARTIFLTTWELAELKERPTIDKQLPPELKLK